MKKKIDVSAAQNPKMHRKLGYKNWVVDHFFLFFSQLFSFSFLLFSFLFFSCP